MSADVEGPSLSTERREHLLDVAEEMFDRLGIGGASVAGIRAAAGIETADQLDPDLQDRYSVVVAVILRRSAIVDARRHQLLDQVEAAGPVTPRDALVTLLRPLVDLFDVAWGRRYLRLLNQGITHGDFQLGVWPDFDSSATRAARYLAPLLAHLDPPLRARRINTGLGMIIHALADQALLIDAEAPARPIIDGETFLNDLVDTTIAMLSA